MRFRTVALLTLCAGCLLVGSACFAADDASLRVSGVPAVLADQETAKLLHTIEQQISSGRIVAPADDNAMETWQRVLQREIGTQGNPGVHRALADFEARMRISAADEKTAGRTLVAAELTLFADQAGQIVGHNPQTDPTRTAAAGTDVATPDARPAEPAAAAAPADRGTRELPPVMSAAAAVSPPAVKTPDAPSVKPAGAGESSSVARGPDTTAAGDVTQTSPAPSPARVTIRRTTQDRAMAAFYATRGDEMLGYKDISAARRFYEYAANAGSARAATALAKTYEAAFIDQQELVGLRPDPALAAEWYRKTASLKDPDVEAELLKRGAGADE